MITYRTAGPWGPGAGANLSPAQVDYNFHTLETSVQDISLNAPQPVQIASFSSSGNQLFIYMSDGTVQGPITMPVVRWFWRGNWAPNTVYSVDNVFAGPDSAVYLTLFNHTSGVNFSPNANDGQGHAYYGTIFQVPSVTIPIGGETGTVLTKSNSLNYAMEWRAPGIPTGGADGEVLRKFSSQEGDAGWSTIPIQDLSNVAFVAPFNDGDYLRWHSASQQWINQPRPMLNVLRETSWYPTVGDEGSFMVLTNSTFNVNVTIPHSSSENFPVGSELHIHQDGTGQVNVVTEDGVTLLKPSIYTTRLLGQYATATVKKTNTNEWRLFGLLAGA